MRLGKHLQYGLLFTLYLCRSGRATVGGVAEGLNLSQTFLEQVARRLRLAGVVKSVRGPNGGYELKGEPTVQDVLNALHPVQLLTKKEMEAYSRGGHEARAFAGYVNTLSQAWSPLLRRKVRAVGQTLVANEMARLQSIAVNKVMN